MYPEQLTFVSFLCAQEAVSMTKPVQDPEEAAKQLLHEACQRGSADNITCIVVRFLANQIGGSSRPAITPNPTPTPITGKPTV